MAGHRHFPRVGRLHTDVLEARFGTITPRVLHHDDAIREVCLNDADQVCRTYAVTFFTREGHPESLTEVTREIRAGASMGKTFRAHGYAVCKNVLKVFLVRVPGWLRHAFADSSAFAKARMTEFLARRGRGATLAYGTVIEVYHPDFRKAAISPSDRLQESPTVASLLKYRLVPAEQIWEYVAASPPHLDREDASVRKAMQHSRMKIREIINVFTLKLASRSG